MSNGNPKNDGIVTAIPSQGTQLQNSDKQTYGRVTIQNPLYINDTTPNNVNVYVGLKQNSMPIQLTPGLSITLHGVSPSEVWVQTQAAESSVAVGWIAYTEDGGDE